MKIEMNVINVILIVGIGAFIGMALGALFGWGAGTIAPSLFANALQPMATVDPIGTAVVLGATAGILLGAALAGFGVVVQVLMDWLK